MRIGLLNNLRAGRSDDRVSCLLGFLKNHPDVLHVETSSVGVVPEALWDLASEDIDVLVVNGGDGTLQHTLTEVIHNGVFGGRIPMIAPLRGGRTNMSAIDIGAAKDPVTGLSRIIEAANAGTIESLVCPRPVLRVEYGPHRDVRYGMFFGAGVISRAIQLTHRLFPSGKSRGVAGPALVTAGLLGRLATGHADGILEPNKVQFILDGVPARGGEYHLVISSSLRRLFARMQPFWGKGPGDVRLTTVETGAQRLGRAVPGILRGRPLPWVGPETGYESRNVHRADLKIDCGFTVDGELVDPEPGRTLSLTADTVVRFIGA